MQKQIVATAFAVMISIATGAQAQTPATGLADHPADQLRQELDQRYSAALQATQSPEFIRAADSRYTWASEAKVECGIAIGFLKSGTRDRESIARCEDSYNRMLETPRAMTPETPPLTPVAMTVPTGCTVSLPVSIFFDWNVDAPPANAQAVAASVVSGMRQCGWSGLVVNGHADKSGSDEYNLRLSERRALGIAHLLEASGEPAAAITTKGYGESVPKIDTAEGVREPMNRRVEINAAGTNQ